MANLLTNGGFEAQWDGNHDCLIFPGSNLRQIENIFTPAGGWITWFYHQPGTWDQPEVTDAWQHVDARRVRSGEKGVKLFTFYRKHDAGLLQQVQVEPGANLHLTAWAHAWSNHDASWAGDCADDGLCSCGVGREQVAIRCGDELPLTGEPWNDSVGNVSFFVGIDPTGGTDPTADSVQWGQGYHVYNGYVQELSADAVAVSSTVTVFLRSLTMWPFKHNDAYWDDVTLAVVEDEPEPEPPEPDYPVYDRTYVLLPPTATGDDVEALAVGWDRRRHTLGASADDAGIGAHLSRRIVIGLNPGEWGEDGLTQAWYDEYYPGAEFYPLYYDTSYQLAGRRLAYELKLYSGLVLHRPTTHDVYTVTSAFGALEPWRNGIDHCGLDLRSSYVSWGDEILSATPGKVVQAGWHSNTGGFGYRVRVETALDDGRVVLVRYAHLMQYIPVSIGQTVAVGDVLGRADSTGTSTGDHLHIDVWDVAAGGYADPALLMEPWDDSQGTEPQPEPPEPEPEPGPCLVGMHLQTMSGGWERFVSQLQPSVMKVMSSMQDVETVRRMSPSTAVVWRHFSAGYGDTLECPDPMQGARNWVDKFRDSLYEMCNQMHDLPEPLFYVESVNEVYPPTQRAADFDCAFIDALAETGLPIAPVVMTAAVGNPEIPEYELLVPLARKCQQAGGLFGYHCYWWANVHTSGLASWFPYHAGRWMEMDKVLVQNGVYVRWFGGESGAVGSADGFSLNAHAGWMSPHCYGGEWARYEADILQMNRAGAEWNRTHGNRFLGFVLFTTGSGATGWSNFQIGVPEVEALIEAFQQ